MPGEHGRDTGSRTVKGEQGFPGDQRESQRAEGFCRTLCQRGAENI